MCACARVWSWIGREEAGFFQINWSIQMHHMNLTIILLAIASDACSNMLPVRSHVLFPYSGFLSKSDLVWHHSLWKDAALIGKKNTWKQWRAETHVTRTHGDVARWMQRDALYLSPSKLIVQMCAIQQWDWSQWHFAVGGVCHGLAADSYLFFPPFFYDDAKENKSQPLLLCRHLTARPSPGSSALSLA